MNNNNHNNNNEVGGDADVSHLRQNGSPDHCESCGALKKSVDEKKYQKETHGCKLARREYLSEEPAEKKRHKMHSSEDSLPPNLSAGQGENPATLEPFIHQVTGRSHMLSLTSTTLCKSLLPQELLFYTSMPEDMQRHVPELRGVLYAQLGEPSSENDHKFTTAQLFLKSDLANLKNASFDERAQKRIELGDHEMLDPKRSAAYKSVLFKGLERFKYGMSSGFSSHPWTVDKDADALTESVGANPWSLRQHRREINSMLSKDALSEGQLLKDGFMGEVEAKKDERKRVSPGKLLRGYMLLEDVTVGFRHPNVMDLKIGNQIERDDCSQAKKDKHLQLAKNSTTGTLFLRLAGMQVYQVDSAHYLCRDKYYGRGLSSSGFVDNMKQFLHNGHRTISEVIPPMIKQLKELHATLEKLDTFRFYASSLLLLYEGGAEDGRKCPGCENTILNEDVPHGDELQVPKVVVRMIDFAHSTYKDFNGDKTLHQGPDRDCLQAILNLITMLEAIQTADMNSADK